MFIMVDLPPIYRRGPFFFERFAWIPIGFRYEKWSYNANDFVEELGEDKEEV